MASKVESTGGATGSGTSTKVPSPSSASHTGNPSLIPNDRRLDEPLNLPPVQWPDDEESETIGNLLEVSPEMTSFLESCFGKPLNNSARQGLHKMVGIPKVDTTNCPMLDRVVKEASQRRLRTLILP